MSFNMLVFIFWKMVMQQTHEANGNITVRWKWRGSMTTLEGGWETDCPDGRRRWLPLLLEPLLPKPGFFTVEEWSLRMPPKAESALVKEARGRPWNKIYQCNNAVQNKHRLSKNDCNSKLSMSSPSPVRRSHHHWHQGETDQTPIRDPPDSWRGWPLENKPLPPSKVYS